MRLLCRSSVFFLLGLSIGAAVRADVLPNQVLVVYNSQAFTATTLKNYYLAAHPGIPAANVLDLNDTTWANEFSYADFITHVRNPIRNYFSLPGSPSPSQIIAICLIRPFPHRVMDPDDGDDGDVPYFLYEDAIAGDANNASLDAELVLLWQDLDAGEANGLMDSYSDNMIVNPYHKLSSPIQTYSRANITIPKVFTNAQDICWLLGGSGPTQLTPGDMYLVCRIDGSSLADAEAEIDRAKNLIVNKAAVKVLLDEPDFNCDNSDDDGLFSNDSSDPFWGGDDYELTRDTLVTAGWNVHYDNAYNFISSSEETAPLIGYASYGENDGPSCGESESYGYIQGYHFAAGAMFNTIESYNARDLNGIGGLFNQEQISDFIASGGTFGVGNVYEPFSFTVPDNAFLMPNMLVNGLTFAEAAYTSLPALSWQQVAVGDPLAKMTIINDPGLPRGDMNGDGHADGRDIVWFIDVVLNGPAHYRATFPTLDPLFRGDFTGDYKVTVDDLPGFINALLTAP
ncbi:MAG TPA: hypothetical protein VMV81_02880 [Phycisphaerae bacterium]|nr:hypothetical protein [Phycisphaerae bacterium]